MTAIVFNNPRPQFFDSNGNPLSFGRVSFYEAGTTTLKDVYSDHTGTIPITNPNVLDAEGYVQDGGIWLGSAPYKVVLERSDGGGGFIEDWTVDFVAGSDSGDSTITSAVVDTMIDLRALEGGSYDSVTILGYYAKGDGGGGTFYWDSSNGDTDNAGTIITPNGSPAFGRWLRVINSVVMYPMYFGIKPDDSSVKVESLINSMYTWCFNNPQFSHVHFGKGLYDISGSINLLTHTEIDEGVQFISSDAISSNVTFNGTAEINSFSALVDTNLNLQINSSNDFLVYPEWWGAVGDGVADDSQEIQLANDNASGKTIAFTQLYNVLNLINITSNFVYDKGQLIPNTVDITFSGVSNYNIKNWSIYDGTGVINNFDLETLYEIMLNGSSEGAELVWEGKSKYTFANSSSFADADKIYHDVKNGTILEFNAVVQFGTVPYEAKKIFSTSSTLYPIIYNMNVIPQWWSFDSVGIEMAFISTSQNTKDQFIDGLGYEVDNSTDIDLNVSVGAANALVTARLKNMTLEGSGNIVTNTHLKLLNVRGTADITQTSVGTTQKSRLDILDSIVNDITTTDTNYTNIKTSRVLGTMTNTTMTKLEVKSSELNSAVSDCVDVQLVGNTFSDNITVDMNNSDYIGVISGNLFDGFLLLDDGVNVTISGNTFRDRVLFLVDCAVCIVSDNTFYSSSAKSNIFIDAGTPASVSSGNLITNNHFGRAGGSPSADTIELGANIATSGHTTNIFDNSSAGYSSSQAKTTRPGFTIEVDTSSGFTQDGSSGWFMKEQDITLTNYILPNGSQPLRLLNWFGETIFAVFAATPSEANATDSVGVKALECKFSDATRNATLSSVKFKIYWTTRLNNAGVVDNYTQDIQGILDVSKD